MSEFRRVFISGPTEMSQVAIAVKGKLESSGHQVVLMPFDPQPLEPGRLSLKELAQCQAVILLLGSKYGTPRPEFGNKSITELEFEETIQRRIPLFCFIGKDDSQREARLATLVQKVEQVASSNKLDFTYARCDFTNQSAVAQEICRAVETFRWTPMEFSSFGEWEVFLANMHARISNATPNPDKLPQAIGRIKARQDFVEILLSKDKGGVVLSGLPAHGKTIFTFHSIRSMLDAAQVGYPDIHIIPSGKSINIESIRHITPDPKSERPVIIVIDDADEREDLPNLLRTLASSTHFARMRVILICQEGAENEISSRCHPLVTPKLFPLILLGKLSDDDLKEYVRSNHLGLSEQNILAIHGITNGVPLYVDLYFHHGYDIRTISTSIDMQSHFRDYILGEVRNQGKESQLAAAKALALTGGASPDDTTLKSVFEELHQPGELKFLLSQLKQQYIVYSVGRKYKLHNRIVQDFILSEYWAKKPDSDLILPLILKVNERAKPILENIARAEWVIAMSSTTKQPSPFADVWAAMEVSFSKSVDIKERTDLLKLLADAAYYQRDLGLRLLRQTHKRYIANLKDLDAPQKDEVEAASRIAYVLAQIARDDMPLFEECIDYLWDFGKYDTRMLNSCPSHAHRHLESLTEFRPGRKMVQYKAILAHAQKWLEQGLKESSDWDHAPLEIIKELLEKEWEQTFSKGHAFTIQRGPLGHTSELENLKIEVIELIIRCIRGEYGPRIISEATHLLRGQLPIYQPPEWTKLGEVALSRLETLTIETISQERPEAAYALIYVLEDLLDVFKESKGKEERGMAVIREARNRLDEEFRTRFPQKHAILQGLLGRRFTGPAEENIQRAQKVLIDAGVNLACKFLEEIHTGLLALGIQPHTTTLAYRSENNETWVDFSAQLARHILDNTKNRGLLWGGIQYIWGCRIAAIKSEAHRVEYLSFLEAYKQRINSAHTTKEERHDLDDACRRLIWVLLKDYPGTTLLNEEMALVAQWKGTPDYTWGFIVAKLAEQSIGPAKALLLSASIGEDSRFAAEICSTLVNSPSLLAAFDESDWNRLLDALITIPKIEDHWICDAVTKASNKHPLLTATFFEKRIKYYATLGDNPGDYRPLPYAVEDCFPGAFASLTTALKAQLINRAIDFIRDSGLGNSSCWHYAEYVNLISNQMTGEADNVLQTRAISSNPLELRAIAYIIQHSYPDFALDHVDVVDRLLTSAQKISEDTFRSVVSSLSAGAHTRSISREIGKPAQEYIKVKARAAEIKRQFLPDSGTYKFYDSLEKSAAYDLEREAADDAEAMDE